MHRLLFVIAAVACDSRPRPPVAPARAEIKPTAATTCDPKTAPRGPGVSLDGRASTFTVTRDRPPVDLRGTAAAKLSFTHYQYGCFQIWHARGIPATTAGAVWSAVVERGASQDLVAFLDRDESLNDYYYEQFIAEDAVEACKAPDLEVATAARRKSLGKRVEAMELALAGAKPSTKPPDHSDPEPASLTSLTVIAGGVTNASCFLVTGAELQPKGDQLTSVLRHWRDRYGAKLMRWSGHHISLRVDKPPTELSELRRLALEFFLFCPAHPSGLTSANEAADELLARVAAREWDCSWFVE